MHATTVKNKITQRD
ncbi:TPA: two-component system connector SafA, partial [Escherichia coli]|nr:two-component system connector SafA [Escherichia coli]HDX7731572.1 two-component system connector SafA [Escherichia coli]HEA1306406.1 two-component system connector SafA [Escherichia coli]HEA2227653.1 two-component system connector SafA [Escherichia coli]